MRPQRKKKAYSWPNTLSYRLGRRQARPFTALEDLTSKLSNRLIIAIYTDNCKVTLSDLPPRLRESLEGFESSLVGKYFLEEVAEAEHLHWVG